ncbi:hypothetical protein MXAN_0099 [Myxococcus xanthus DK 1622]|uniref:Uncharacterized protein n=1 Tax=Myxococcus xanthus (strain DK1622) TaxID=246197 RepID=Q1DG41_MYXXD|nr:hypothetical protein MXAN_0099 [Myxococcus xanthus DK 1622]
MFDYGLGGGACLTGARSPFNMPSTFPLRSETRRR